MSDLPTVKQLHSPVDGEALEVSGYFATWDEDSEADAFLSTAFDEALPRFLKLNPVVLYNHDREASLRRGRKLRVLGGSAEPRQTRVAG